MPSLQRGTPLPLRSQFGGRAQSALAADFPGSGSTRGRPYGSSPNVQVSPAANNAPGEPVSPPYRTTSVNAAS